MAALSLSRNPVRFSTFFACRVSRVKLILLQFNYMKSFFNYFTCTINFNTSKALRCGLKQSRNIHVTRIINGIGEFFPRGALESNQPQPEEVKSGRSWKAAELRRKSNADLHKLWYVLLKERNMLLTVAEEAKRLEVIMPSPERLHKVKKSMAMIKVVLHERKCVIEVIEARYYSENMRKSCEISVDNSIESNSQVCVKSAEIPAST